MIAIRTLASLVGLLALPLAAQVVSLPDSNALPVRLDTTLLQDWSVSGGASFQMARLNGDRVNLRARPSLAGVVIGSTRLEQIVEVMEVMEVAASTNSAPTRWAKIRLPSDIPVWIHGDYVDPISRKVSASRLNLRGGPSEAYGILGRMEEGEVVKVLGNQDGWIKIEAPDHAYAFLAAKFLDFEEGKADLKVVAVPEVATSTPPKEVLETPVAPVLSISNAPVAPISGSLSLNPIEPEPPLNMTLPGAEISIQVPVDHVVDLSLSEVPAQPAMELPVDLEFPRAEVAPPLPEVTLQESEARRVIREGVVVRTWNPKAPTYYALEDPRTGRTIHFLYPADTGLQLKPYKGRLIRVTGPELMDQRWSRPSMIRIETLELLD